jgi:hypothetical protein
MDSRFQQTCDTLDALLAKDKSWLKSQNIKITDWSFFGNREPLSCWSYAFELRWAVPPFIVNISVRLSSVEPPPNENNTATSIARLAEVFQVGAVPHMQNRYEEPVTVDDVINEGMGSLVIRQLEQVRASLPSGYQMVQ